MSDKVRRARSMAVWVMTAALIVTIVPSVAAHDAVDTVDADRAYAGDPLFPLWTGAGLFPNHAPDTTSAMGSTTKVMTLIVALDAVKAGVVDLDDIVTIDLDAAIQPGSQMVDEDGAPLAVGERLRLRLLLAGLIVQSGNNAAWAIAEHVAKGYFGELGTVDLFVGLMNARANAIGLAFTSFANPSGLDASGHVTTARDLARIWMAGMEDAAFREFVQTGRTWEGDGTFLASTVIKHYEITKPGGYPGIEGHKNGKTPNCSGADDSDQCFVGSARRIGRRIVIAGMQSDGVIGGTTGDAAEIWDYAFRRLFHPDYRGGSALSDAASKLSLACPATGRAVTASLGPTGRTLVTSWATSLTNKTYTILGKRIAPTGSLGTTNALQIRDLDAIALNSSRLVTATRVSNDVELRLWNIPSTGAPSVIGSAVGSATAGTARSIELVKLSSTMFASVTRSTTDRLVVRTWRRTNLGLQLLKSVTISNAIVDGVLEVDAASASGQSALRFVVVVRRAVGNPLLLAYGVNATTGTLSGWPAKVLPQAGSQLSIVPAPVEALPDEVIVDKFYAIGFKRSNGGLGLVYARIGFDGMPGAFSSVATAGGVTGLELAPFGTSGLVTLARLSDTSLKPIVWESRRNADGTVTALRISDHASTVKGNEPEICSAPTTRAEGDFITGLREGSTPSIRIRGWRVGDRP
jgi:D-alanyl-D-alanine carboxypeptidase